MSYVRPTSPNACGPVKRKRKCNENEKTRELRSERTNLDTFPPAEVDAPRLVLEGDAPAERDEAPHLQRLYAERYPPYQLLRLRRRPRIRVNLPVGRPVQVDFRHGRLEHALRVPRKGHVDFEHGLGREFLAILDEGGVRWVRLDSGGVRL